MSVRFWTILVLLNISPFAFAAATSPITYHGRILVPDGSAEQDTAVQFKIQIRSPGSENCLMYEETQTLNMAGTGGAFSLTINGATSARTDGSGFSVEQIMGNHGTFTFAGGACSIGTTYTPTSIDGRAFQVFFKDSTMASFDSFPTQAINLVPKAIDAEQVAGFPASSLLRVDNAGVPGAAASFSTAQFTALQALISGSSTQYVPAGSTGASLPAFAANPPGPIAGDVWYDSTAHTVKYFDGTSVQTFGVGGGSVSSITAGTGLTGGTISTTGTIALSNVGVAGTYTKVTTDAQGRVTAGAQITGADITSGTIGGTTSMNSSGNVLVTNVSSTTDSTNNLRIFENTNTHKITVTAPAALAADYGLTLPPALTGVAGYVLSSDTSGVLSWVNPLATIGPGSINTFAYVNGGNSFGGPASLGTNDANTLTLKTNAAARMTLDAAGNVGVGTSLPTDQLYVVTNQAPTSGGGISLQNTNSGSMGVIRAYNDVSDSMVMGMTGSTWPIAQDQGSGIISTKDTNLFISTDGAVANGGTHSVIFMTGGYNASPTMMVGNGKVGIGTTNPGGPFDVEGGTAGAATSGLPIKLVAQSGGTGNQLGGDVSINPGAGTGTGGGGSIQLNPGSSTSGLPGAVNINLPFLTQTSGNYTGVSMTPFIVPAAPTTATYVGMTPTMAYNAFNVNSPSAKIYGGQLVAGNYGGSSTVGSLIGAMGWSRNSGSLTTVTNAYGIQGSVFTGLFDTTTSAYGGYFDITSSGTTTNGYGVYTGPIAATNKWSIYASDATAPSYFAGNVGIGTTTPNSLLQIFNGEAQVGTSGAACAAGNAGAIRYAAGSMSFCNGAAWTAVASGGGAALPEAGGTMTGQLVGEDGTAPAPAFALAGDLGTGFYQDSAHVIGVSNNGTESMKLSASGITGTGALTVAAGGTNQNLVLSGSGTGGVILTPNVGIGTTAPSYALDVVGTGNETIAAESNNTTATAIVIKNTSAGGHNWQLFGNGSAGTGGPGHFGLYDLTSDKTHFAVDAPTGDFMIRSGANYAWSSDPSFAGEVSNDTGLARNTAGVVEVNNGTAGQIRDLRVRSFNPTGGNVGIGSTSPTGTLDVEGGSAAAAANGVDISLVAQSAGAGNQNGGNVTLIPGAATGTGLPGKVKILGPAGAGYTMRDTSGTDYSFSFGPQAIPVAASTATFGGITSSPVWFGAVNSPAAQVVGVYANPWSFSPTTVGSMTGVLANTNNNWVGIVTNGYGVQSEVTNTSSGSITNGYGIYTGSIQATNKWSVYASDATAPSYFAANVGIGTTAPSSLLQVFNGEAQVGTSGAACTAGNAGAIRYSAGAMSFCNGAAWTTLASGGGAALPEAGGTMTGQVIGEDGTAAAPAYALTGDTGTGFYQDSAHVIGVSNNGTESMKLSAAGITGTGAITVAAGGTNQNLTLSGSGTGGVILTPNVGIGTATPQGPLDVEGGTSGSGNGSNIFLVAQNGKSSGVTNGGNIILKPGMPNSTGYPGGVFVQGQTGGIGNLDVVTTDYITGSTGSLVTLANGAASGATYSYLQAYTAGTTATGILALNPNGGNVGIGTTAPGAPLDIANTTSITSGSLNEINVKESVLPSANSTASVTGLNLTIDTPVANTHGFANNTGANFVASNESAGQTYNSIYGLSSFAMDSGNTNTGSQIVSYGGVAAANGTGGTYSYVTGSYLNTTVGASTVTNQQALYFGQNVASNSTVTNLAGASLTNQVLAGTVTNEYGASLATANFGATVTNDYGVYVNSTKTGGSTTNRYGLYLTATGAATNDYGVYQQTSGQKNYFAGTVGIGTTTPTSLLQVYNGEAQVGTSGAACAAGNAGAIRYTAGAMSFCNGAAWTALANGSGAALPEAGGTMSGQLVGEAGTAAAPSYSLTGDTGTGFYQDSAHVIGVSNNGTESMKLSATGITGTGAITVAAGGTNQNLTLSGSGTGGVILTPNVGIGTTTPSGPFEVQGGTAAAGNGANITITGQAGASSGSTNGGNIVLDGGARFGAGTAGGISLLSNTTLTGNLVQNAGSGNAGYTGSSGAANVPLSVTSMGSNAAGNSTFLNLRARNSTATDQYTYFGTVPVDGVSTPNFVIGLQSGATAYTERLRIDQNGNVGIGSTNPPYKFVVAAGVGDSAFTTTDFVLGSVGSELLIGNGANTGDTYSEIQSRRTGGLVTGDLILQRVGGSVGIGTTSPVGTLDVEGGTAAAGSGSNIQIVAQNGKQAGNTNGGSVNISSGNGHGSGAGGAVQIGGANNGDSNGVGIGYQAQAGGTNGVAVGFFSLTGGVDSVAVGPSAKSSGDFATALGSTVCAGDCATSPDGVGDYSVAIGAGNATGVYPKVTGTGSVGIFMGDQSGANVSVNNVMAILGGNVGIGTTTPATALDVHGAIFSETVANAAGITSIDFTAGNVQTSANTTNNASFNICGLKDGGSYSLVLTGQPVNSTPTFAVYSDSGCSAGIAHFDSGGVALVTTSATTILTFIRAGNTVYAMIATGFTH